MKKEAQLKLIEELITGVVEERDLLLDDEDITAIAEAIQKELTNLQ